MTTERCMECGQRVREDTEVDPFKQEALRALRAEQRLRKVHAAARAFVLALDIHDARLDRFTEERDENAVNRAYQGLVQELDRQREDGARELLQRGGR